MFVFASSNPSRAIGALFVMSIMLTPASAVAQKPAGFDASWRDLAQWYHSTLQAEGVVGAALWFTAGGQVLGREFHGMADLETARRVDENTIFHWASITKTLTGIAILQLRDRGRLSLDDPLTRYLPELRAVHNPFGSMDDITIRHALTHSAGFRAPTWPWGGGESWHPHEPTEWSQIVAMLPYTEILFEPGSRSRYSNPAIAFLGRIIEVVTGDDYEVYADKNILKPLGMQRSYFDVTPYHLLPHRSNNYVVRDGTPVSQGLDFDTGITTSNSGLNAPIPDMLRYLAFLTGHARETTAAAVLQRSSLQEMWTRQYALTSDTANTTTRESMGLVFFLLEHGQRSYIGHTGSQKAFLSFFYVDPATGTSAIAVFNTNGAGDDPRPDTDRLVNALRTRLFDSIFPLFGSI